VPFSLDVFHGDHCAHALAVPVCWGTSRYYSGERPLFSGLEKVVVMLKVALAVGLSGALLVLPIACLVMRQSGFVADVLTSVCAVWTEDFLHHLPPGPHVYRQTWWIAGAEAAHQHNAKHSDREGDRDNCKPQIRFVAQKREAIQALQMSM
jgi:hypothetical protein